MTPKLYPFLSLEISLVNKRLITMFMVRKAPLSKIHTLHCTRLIPEARRFKVICGAAVLFWNTSKFFCPWSAARTNVYSKWKNKMFNHSLQLSRKGTWAGPLALSESNYTARKGLLHGLGPSGSNRSVVTKECWRWKPNWLTYSGYKVTVNLLFCSKEMGLKNV